jgi:predicted dehydrogenase
VESLDSIWNQAPAKLIRSDYRIGVIGAGFVIRDVHLIAYQNAGYQVAAIASRTPETATAVANLRGVPRVYDSYEELLFDDDIQIIDIAVPPAHQIEVVRKVVQHAKHVKGVLAQKPLAMNFKEALETVRLCEASDIKLAVNQNMRYDPSIRAAKALLQAGYLGEPVFATIEMRAVPHWQSWLRDHDRLTLLNMSVHHLDSFRFLFGTPDSVYASARNDPRTRFAHRDGVCVYILEYESGLRASGWDDIWAGPGADNEQVDAYIKWRVEGTEGVAQGTIGWPGYPNRTPSTLEFTTAKHPRFRFEPLRKRVWFPDAFEGTMAELMNTVASGVDSNISGRDNLDTMALVDACYLSLEEHRPVRIGEIRSREKATEARL